MYRSSVTSLLRISFCILLVAASPAFKAKAQDAAAPGWSPAEQLELFGYCEKGFLMNQLKLSSETADKIGLINYWATVTKISVAANTNDTFATPKEVEEGVVRKYKALGISGDQLKELMARREKTNNGEPCAVTVLTYDHYYDTLTAPRIIQLYKLPAYRKPLIDKTGILGRQADMLFEIEAWKQKEAAAIAAIPVTDFARIRRTVAMHNERERRYKVVGLTDAQIALAIEYFDQHSLGVKK